MDDAPREAAALTPWVTAFGDDPDDWNLHRDDDEEDGEGSGLPGISVVAEAFRLYHRCVGSFNAAQAAQVFNLPVDLAELAIVAMPPFNAFDDVDLVLSEVSSLIATWVALRGDEPSVALAAATFRWHPTLVIEAVGDGFWLYLSGDRDNLEALHIGIDGE